MADGTEVPIQDKGPIDWARHYKSTLSLWIRKSYVVLGTSIKFIRLDV